MTKNVMTAKELEKFMDDFGMGVEEFAHVLGITRPAVDHWVTGRRSIPPTTVKLIKFFKKNPTMLEKFDA